MLHLVERRIVCTCEACWALYSGNAEYRPTGMRTVWLDEFRCDEEIWAAFQIPIGLAFFMRSTVTDSVVAFYPSPAGATESELTLEAWAALVEVNPVLAQLDPDAEALVVNRMGGPGRIRDHPDRPVLRPGRADQITLGGHLGWERDRGGGAAVLRRGPGPRGPGLGGDAMSLSAEREDSATRVPEPEFVITSAAHMAFAATPTMVFAATATDPTGIEIQSIALTAQVMIDPAKRGYDPDTRERLSELFGAPAAWAPSTSGLSWARVAVTVPGFTGSTAFALEVPGTYDLEVASAKYFHAVRDGEVPLSFHFNGNVFYRGPAGQLQVVPVSWSNSAQFRMPVSAWRAMIAEHYPGLAWIRLSEDTLEALNDRRASRGLPSFDACIEELLHGVPDDE